MCSLFKKVPYWNSLTLIHKKQTTNHTKRILSMISPDGIQVPVKLKGRFASDEQKRLIQEFIINSSLTKIDWNALKISVLSINRGYINEKNIHGYIFEVCTKQKRLDLAKSYMKHLKESNQTKPNVALELLYIRSCYVSRDQLTDDDCYEIQISCQSILKKYLPVLNSVLLEGIVMGLCCTPVWRDSLKYMKALKNDNGCTINTLVCIVHRAFEEGEIDLGWTLIQMIFNQSGTVPLEVFVAWFNLCEQNINYSYLKVLEFLKDNEFIVREDLAELIKKKLKQFGCKVSNTTINHNGGCRNCHQVLKTVEVTDTEFKLLQDRFMSNVVVGKNIFNNSSPQELQDFKDFIEITAPYDVVVDGLNLAYAYRGKVNNDSIVLQCKTLCFIHDMSYLSKFSFKRIEFANKTKTVLKNFINQKLKVLLIGRKHLVKIMGKEFDFIKKNVHLFFTNDLSKDDPFVLYATMYSGLGTKILTRDLMRGHKFLLGDPVIQSIFQKWLQKHRLLLMLRKENKVILKNPIPYLQSTQESVDGTWHLPYQELKEPGVWSKPDSSPDNWMCIKTLVN